VGVKDAGASNPDRLLLAFDDGPNEFVGTGQSTRITPAGDEPVVPSDHYSFTVEAGQTITAAATHLPRSEDNLPQIELYDPDGNLVAFDRPMPGNLLTNGSFESGDFSGWTAVQTASPFVPWTVSGAGDGSGFFPLTSPQDGDFVAWNGFDGEGPMEYVLFQDVTIPAEAATATLEWQDRVQWDFTLGANSALARDYEVAILDPSDDSVLATLHSFTTGPESTNPFGDTGWLSHSVDVSAFIGQNVRVRFLEVIPEAFEGPGQYELDGVSLTTDLAGGPSAENVDAIISNFVAPTSGTYTVRVIGEGDYSLIVNKDAAFDTEANNDFASAQEIGESPSILGSIDPELGGAYDAQAVAFGFEDISGTGTPTLIGVDDASVTLSAANLAGFEFDFYGQAYSQLSFSSNGLITFGGSNSDYINTDLSTSPDLAAIAPLWVDLYNVDTGTVYWEVLGEGDDQRLVIQWHQVEYIFDFGTITFQAVLSEADGSIQFNYLDLDSDFVTGGEVGTVGVKDAGASNPDRLLLAFDDGPNEFVGTGQSTRITPASDTQEADWYAIELEAGQAITMTTRTPGDGPGEFTNTLDPQIELYDENGLLVASSSILEDGRNEEIVFDVPASGTYRLRVAAEAGSDGSYVVSTEVGNSGTSLGNIPWLGGRSDLPISGGLTSMVPAAGGVFGLPGEQAAPLNPYAPGPAFAIATLPVDLPPAGLPSSAGRVASPESIAAYAALVDELLSATGGRVSEPAIGDQDQAGDDEIKETSPDRGIPIHSIGFPPSRSLDRLDLTIPSGWHWRFRDPNLLAKAGPVLDASPVVTASTSPRDRKTR
jgi:hypothetical protein